MDSKKIIRRGRGRAAAAEVISLLADELQDPDFSAALVEAISAHAGLGRQQSETPDDPIPYARLEGYHIPFGRHRDERFSDVPLDYLDWLCRASEEFLRDLQAYLKHPKTRRENNGSD